MSALDELARLLAEKGRRIFVADNPIDLTSLEGTRSIYVLQLLEDSHSAGGRVGGFGERRIEKLYYFHLEGAHCRKVYETEDSRRLGRFELPYHAAGLQVVLPDGSTRVVSGVVDSELVSSYSQVI
jgi:hypothetical protein